MDTKKLVTLGSCLAMTAAVCADSGSRYGDNSRGNTSRTTQSSEEEMPMFEQGTAITSQSDRCKHNYKDCKAGEYPEAYNLAAGYNLREGYDFNVSGSFIYWMASSDGFNNSSYTLNDSIEGTVAIAGTSSDVTLLAANGNGSTSFIKPRFEPGFKIAVGYGDGGTWEFTTQWTRLHQTRHSSLSVSGADLDDDSDDDDDDSSSSSGDVIVLENFPYNILGSSLSQKWRLNMDLLDFMLSRRFYVGRKVIMEPFMGIRAAWFRQSLRFNLTSASTDPWVSVAAAGINFPNASGRATTKNWGLGAIAGTNGQWLLGAGFRLEGKASLSLLFTRFKRMSFSVASTDNVPAPNAVTLSGTNTWKRNFDTVRPQAELGLGFGWGSYFCNQRLHLDLDATYDFNVFWDQQYLRAIPDALTHQTGTNPSDLFFHGPTFTARLDF